MNANILYIDDDAIEANNLVGAVSAELCKIDPGLVVLSADDQGSRYYSGRQLIYRLLKPKDAPSEGDKAQLQELAQRWDFFLLDVCWKSHDVEDDEGLQYAVLLSAAGVVEARILLVTNKAFDAVLRRTRLKTLPGSNGKMYPAASKREPQIIAEELNARTTLSPKRPRIGNTEVVNHELYCDSHSGLAQFFHQGCTKQEAVDSCNALENGTSGLPEVCWLLFAVRQFLSDCTNVKVGSSLERYLLEEEWRGSMLDASADDKLVNIFDLARPNKHPMKLRDWLFPRLSPETTVPNGAVAQIPFVLLVNALAKRCSVEVKWVSRNLPFSLGRPSYKVEISGVSSVPLSWFKGMQAEGWLAESVKHRNITGISAHVFGCEGRGSGKHCCVAFWHDAAGFDSLELIKSKAPKTVRVCAEFSHVFVASRPRKEPKTPALCEMLPDGQSIEKPLNKVQIGETIVDFTKLERGTVYLFAFPAVL